MLIGICQHRHWFSYSNFLYLENLQQYVNLDCWFSISYWEKCIELSWIEVIYKSLSKLHDLHIVLCNQFNQVYLFIVLFTHMFKFLRSFCCGIFLFTSVLICKNKIIQNHLCLKSIYKLERVAGVLVLGKVQINF